MQLLKPITFQASQIVSTNAVETYPAWSSATTYAKDAFVDYGTFIYQSLVNSNLNKQPDISPADWLLIGPDNTHAMFDNQVSTQTTSTSPLNVTINPGRAINSAAFINLTGTQLVVTMTDGAGGPTVYTKTENLDGSIVEDWYDYFFGEFDQRTDVVLTDLPSYINGRISMSLTGTGSVKIGLFTYGTVYTLGLTQYGASSGITDYSVKQTDDFGNTTFVQRAYSKRMEASLFVENIQLNKTQKILTDVRATPCVWIGSQDSRFNPLIVFGFYKQFSTTINYPTYSLCSLEIEGLI
jgi:hypothetical protein